MKVEELMVGDLVKDKGVVTQIDNFDFIEDSKNLSPIEITEDILLKSNFKKATTYDEGEFYYAKDDSEYYCNIKICHRPKKNLWVIHTERFNIGENSKFFLREFDGHIKYIHELQHILRLIGIEKEVIL